MQVSLGYIEILPLKYKNKDLGRQLNYYEEQEELSLNPKFPHKKLGVAMHSCNSSNVGSSAETLLGLARHLPSFSLIEGHCFKGIR